MDRDPDPTLDRPPAQPASAAPAADAPRRRGVRVLGWLAAGLLALVGAGLGAAWWLAATEPGLRTLLSLAARASGGAVAAEGVQGRLAGPLRIASLRVRTATLDAQAAQVALDWDWRALWRRQLWVRALSVAELRVVTTPGPDDEPARLPADLRLPGAVRIDRLSIDTLRIGEGDAPLVLSGLAVRLDSDGVHTHRFQELRVRTPWGDAVGSLVLGARAPFTLQAQAGFDGLLPAAPAADPKPAAGAPRAGAAGAERPVQAQASADGTLERFVLALRVSGALDAQARATLQPFAAVPIGQTELTLRGVDPSQWRAGLPHAVLALRLRLAPAGTDRGDWRTWTAEGPLELVNDAPGPIDQDRVPLRRLTAMARWQAQQLGLDGMRIELPRDASLAGDVRWTPQPAPGSFAMTLRAAGVDAQALHGALQPTRLSGTLQASGDASRQQLAMALTEPRFALEAKASHADAHVQIQHARLGARDAFLEARGEIALDGARAFSVDGRLVGFDPKVYVAGAPPARLSATLSARGELPAGQGVRAQLRFALAGDSRLDGRPLGGQGRLEVIEQRIDDADIDLDLAGNRLFARGAFGRPGDQLALRVDAPRLAALGFGLAGSVQAEGRVGGSPKAPTGRLRASASGLSLPGGHRIARLQADAALDQGVDGPLSADVTVADWRRDGTSEPLLGQGSVELRGTLREHALGASLRATPAGDLALRVRGGLSAIGAGAPAGGVELIGAFAEGAAQWRGSIERLELAGRESVRLVAPAALAARRDAVRVEGATLASSRGRAVVAELAWSPQAISSRGRFEDVPLPPELLAAANGVRSTLRLAGQWDVRVGDTLGGTVRIARQQGDVVLGGKAAGGTPFDAELPLGLSVLQLELDAAGEKLAAAVRVQGERVGTLAGQGSVALARAADGQWGIAPDAPIAAAGELTVPDLDWVGPALDPGVRTGGSIAARLRVSGPARAPVVAGSVDGDRLRVRLLEQGVDLADGRVRLSVDESLLTLREAVFTAPIRQRPADPRLRIEQGDGPGTLRAEGSIRIAGPGRGQGAIRVQADRLAALQTRDRWLMASGTAALTLGEKQLSLTGDLRADAGSINIGDEGRPQLGSDVVVIRRSAEDGAAKRADGEASPIVLDLTVGLGERFFVQGRGLDARLAGAVRVRGRVGGTLLATGSVNTVDGSFSAYNQQLAIERGVINFQGPIENPGLNVRAVRSSLRVRPGVEVTGTAQQPRIKLVSTPELPESEKLSWLVLGYPPAQLSGRERELLGSAALALLSGQRGGGGSDFMRSLGVDVGIRSGPSAAPGSATLAQLAAASPGAGTPAAADRIVTVGRRLSDNAYLGVEQSLTGTMTIVQLTYQLSRRLSAVARTGAENALDLIYTFSFR